MKHGRKHRTSCLLSCFLRANRGVPALVPVHASSPRPRVLSYFSTAQTPRLALSTWQSGVSRFTVPNGYVAFRRSRPKVLHFLERRPKCIVEACGSSHYWGREKLGHEVRLLPPVYVKSFVKRAAIPAKGPTFAEGASRQHRCQRASRRDPPSLLRPGADTALTILFPLKNLLRHTRSRRCFRTWEFPPLARTQSVSQSFRK